MFLLNTGECGSPYSWEWAGGVFLEQDKRSSFVLSSISLVMWNALSEMTATAMAHFLYFHQTSLTSCLIYKTSIRMHTEQHVHIFQHNLGVLCAALDTVVFFFFLIKYISINFWICVIINKEILINNKPIIKLSQCQVYAHQGCKKYSKKNILNCDLLQLQRAKLKVITPVFSATWFLSEITLICRFGAK